MALATGQSLPGRTTAGPDPPPRRRTLLADVVMAALFLAVPLAVCPCLRDPYTSAKWFVLEALAAAWFLSELWGRGRPGWPAFVLAHWRTSLVLVALLLVSSLRSGLAWGAPALLDRTCFALLALASYWYFRRNGGSTASMARSTGVAAVLTAGVGLAQVLGWRPLQFLSGGDQQSAFFGNVNMTAQFLGFAVILLLAGSRSASPVGTRTREVVATACLVYVYFLSCRSVFLALGVALILVLAAGRLSAGFLARLLGTATVAVLLLLRFGPLLGDGTPLRHPLSLEVRAEKALSSQWRLAVWRSTLSMIRDHPLGVGSGNFGDAFIPYQLTLDLIPGERVLFRTPHNEYLRAVAEEGPVFGAIASLLLVSLLRTVSRGSRSRLWRTEVGAFLMAGVAFLAVEAFFQFPFGTAFGCLMAAGFLGLALAVSEQETADEPDAARSNGRHGAWRAAGTVVALAVLLVLGRVVTSEVLSATRRSDVDAQEAACRLNPRNLPACVTAAWLRIQAGERRDARTLLVRTLVRSPYYHPAIRLLGEEAAAAGDRERACLYLWVYDRLLRERSRDHRLVGALCGEERPARLPARTRIPYYGTFPLAPGDSALR
jgi:O-antigen ligase